MWLLVLSTLTLLTRAHDSWGGGEGFAPHVTGDENGIGDDNEPADEQGADDNYMNKDDDRRAYAPAYDDHMSYQHHPSAVQFSDEHFMDDEGQSMRVIHGQDTSKHVSSRLKKKIFDVIKEAKHHFAVQRIAVPFPFHHHYYNHTVAHYHDGFDIYDDDVADSEKYFHVNPDTNAGVEHWFADDHYRIDTELFSDDGDAVGDEWSPRRKMAGPGKLLRSEFGAPSGRGSPNSVFGGDPNTDLDAAVQAFVKYWTSTRGQGSPDPRATIGDSAPTGDDRKGAGSDSVLSGRATPIVTRHSGILDYSDGVPGAGDDGVGSRPSKVRYRSYQDERTQSWQHRGPWTTGKGNGAGRGRNSGGPIGQSWDKFDALEREVPNSRNRGTMKGGQVFPGGNNYNKKKWVNAAEMGGSVDDPVPVTNPRWGSKVFTGVADEPARGGRGAQPRMTFDQKKGSPTKGKWIPMKGNNRYTHATGIPPDYRYNFDNIDDSKYPRSADAYAPDDSSSEDPYGPPANVEDEDSWDSSDGPLRPLVEALVGHLSKMFVLKTQEE